MTITPYTTSFAPVCTGSISTTGVTTAASAYDWFSLTTGTYSTAVSAISNSTPNGAKNKAFLQSISQHARLELLPLVKAELFASKVSSTKTLIANSVTNILNTLTSIQDPDFSTSISTLTPVYNSALATINTALNSLKSFEVRTFVVTDSIDITSAALATSYAATTTLSSFTGLKTYLATMLAPETLAGITIPSITSVNGNAGNAASLSTTFTTVSNALTISNTVANYKALALMGAQNIFDLWCINAQGYANSGTTGVYTGSATVGIIPGVDYEVHATGNFQTGTAASGTAGAPSATVAFW
jgi:hypothetical protein